MLSQALGLTKKQLKKKKISPVCVRGMLQAFLLVVWLSISYSPGGDFKVLFFAHTHITHMFPHRLKLIFTVDLLFYLMRVLGMIYSVLFIQNFRNINISSYIRNSHEYE